MNGNRADAEDAVSTAAIRAASNLCRRTKSIDNPLGWFFRVLHNVCRDFHRRSATRLTFRDGLHAAQVAHLGLVGTLGRSPEDLATSRQRQRRVEAVARGMPPPLREVFERRFFAGDSNADIATDLEISNELVRKRVQLARNYLKNKRRTEGSALHNGA